MDKLSVLTNVSMALVVIWGLLSAAATSLSCSADHTIPSAGENYCVHQVSPFLLVIYNMLIRVFQVKWFKAIAAGDVITEMITVILPVAGLHKLQMPLKSRLLVVFAFSFRLLYGNTMILSAADCKRKMLTLSCPGT